MYIKRISSRLGLFTPQGISSITWALSKLDYPSTRSMYETIESELEKKNLAIFEPVHLSNILFSFSKSKRYDSPIYSLFDKDIVKRDLQDFKSGELSIILFSYSSARKYNSPIYSHIGQEIIKRDPKDFSPRTVLYALQAYSDANLHKSPVFSLLQKEAKNRNIRFVDSKKDVNKFAPPTTIKLPGSVASTFPSSISNEGAQRSNDIHRELMKLRDCKSIMNLFKDRRREFNKSNIALTVSIIGKYTAPMRSDERSQFIVDMNSLYQESIQ